MKTTFYLLVALVLLVFSQQTEAQNAFNKGVNLTGWFGSNSAKAVPFSKYSKKDIEEIKSLGCDVIRLPITLHYMTSGAPDYKVDPVFFNYLDQVIDWTEELGLNLIIDNHTIEVAKSKDVEVPLLKIWPQMAEHYKNRSKLVIYEILNEPNTLAATDWTRIQKNVLDTIRTIDSVHTVVVTGADWGGISGMTNLVPLADSNLIYSFHFYDPFLFTHQAATWTSPSMGDLGNVPFPFDAKRMPSCPASLKGTWIEGSLNSGYKTDGTAVKIKSTIDQAIAYAKKYNVKIYCGELGVYIQKSPVADRVEWYKTVTGYLTEKSVPWTMWDYQGGFGLFNKGSNETFEYDLNRPMAEAMGFTLPPYKEYVFTADTTGFVIYDDSPGKDIKQGGNGNILSTDAYQGNFAVYLTDLAQYSALDFDFVFNKDLSVLRASNTVLKMWVKSTAKDANVVLRFVDTKTTDPKDHPWRMDYKLASTANALFDGEWHQVTIPLKSFNDVGSWDNAWFNSENKFDWKAVDKFQIVAENMALTGKEFWFDNIELIKGEPDPIPSGINDFHEKFAIYPNPVTDKMLIDVFASTGVNIDIAIYNLAGKKVKTVFKDNSIGGKQQIVWDLTDDTGRPVANGIYICKLKFNDQKLTRKVTVIK
jgi:endoglucanase